jgi:hypothetical protein
MKTKVVLLIVFFAIGLHGWSQSNNNTQPVNVEDVSFVDLAKDFNTLNEKDQLMSARSVVRFQPEGTLCISDPLEVLFEKKLDDEDKKYVLYRWDASIRRWVKPGNLKLETLKCGTHDYFEAALSCNGVFGIFEEFKLTKGTQLNMPAQYKINRVKYVQKNTRVVYEWHSRIGLQTVNIPYDDVSEIAHLELEISDDKMNNYVINNLKPGQIDLWKRSDEGITKLIVDKKLIKQFTTSETLKASK